MRKILHMLFLSLPFLCCQAQETSLQATVCDFFTGKMLDSVRLDVLRPDSAIAYSFDSETYGKWNFYGRKVSPGKYILRFSRKDYEPTFIDRTVRYSRYRHDFEELGNVQMHKVYSRTVQLGEVVIRPTLLKMVHRGDTIVYNADAFKLPDGSMLDDLVRMLPGARMDGDGQIFVNGRKVSSLLLNGNDFFNGNPRMALDNLVAYTVKDIKVYERQSDRDMALGMSRDGRELPLVMDVGLKRQYQVGWMGSLEAGGGTVDRYMGRVFLMRFSRQSRVALYADANNVGDDYTYVNSGRWNENRRSDGFHRSLKGGLDVYVKDRRKRFTANGNVEAGVLRSSHEEYTSSTEFYPSGDIHQRKSVRGRLRDTNLSGRLNMSLTPFARTFVKLVPYANYRDFDNASHTLSVDLNKRLEESYRGELLDSVFSPVGMSGIYRGLVNSTLRNNSLGRGHTLGVGTTFEYSHRPKYNNDQLVIKGSAYHGSSVNRTLGDYEEMASDRTSRRYRFGDGSGNRYAYNIGASYSYALSGFPGGCSSWLSLGYDYRQSYSGSHRPFYDLEDTELDGMGLGTLPSMTDELSHYVDVENTYHSTRLDRTHTVSLSLGSDFGNFSLEAGIPLSAVGNSLSYLRGDIDTLASRHAVLLAPYLTLSGKSTANGKTRGFSLKYSLSQSQPDLVQTLSYRDDVTPLVVRLGNPSLGKAGVHRVDARLYAQNAPRFSSASLSLHYRLMTDMLCQSMRYDAATGTRTYQPRNIDGNWDVGISYEYHAPSKSYNRRLSSVSTASYRHRVDFAGMDDNGSSFRNTVRHTSLREDVDYTFFSTNSFDGFQTSASYNANGSIQYTHSESRTGETMNLYDFKFGMRVRQPLPLGLEVEGKVDAYIHCGYRDRNFNTRNFVVSAYVRKTLLRNRLYVKLQVFDLLNQTNRIQYTLNEQMQTETYRNALRRFCMLSLGYNITKQPKKTKT